MKNQFGYETNRRGERISDDNGSSKRSAAQTWMIDSVGRVRIGIFRQPKTKPDRWCLMCSDNFAFMPSYRLICNDRLVSLLAYASLISFGNFPILLSYNISICHHFTRTTSFPLSFLSLRQTVYL